MYVSMYVCMYVCMCVCMYVCVYVCMYVCMNVCAYVYVFINNFSIQSITVCLQFHIKKILMIYDLIYIIFDYIKIKRFITKNKIRFGNFLFNLNVSKSYEDPFTCGKYN